MEIVRSDEYLEEETVKYQVEIGEREYEVEIQSRPSEPHVLDVTMGNETFPVDFRKWHDQINLLLKGRSVTYGTLSGKKKGQLTVLLNGNRYPATVRDENAEVMAEEGPVDGKYKETSPMPGLVKEVKVELGQSVEVGQILLIMEAMKMEMEIKAKYPGKVVELVPKSGASVQEGDDLLLIEVTD